MTTPITVWTDHPVIDHVTDIKAIHINELRDAVNNVESMSAWRIISTEEPTENLNDWLEWYNPSTTEVKVYLQGEFRSIGGGGVILVNENVVTITEPTNIVPIGIAGLRSHHPFFVFKNTVSLSKGHDFYLNDTCEQIINTGGTWDASVEEPTRFHFVSIVTAANPDPEIMSVAILTNSYIAEADNIINIPIGIGAYNPDTDHLAVILANEGVALRSGLHYDLSADKISIDLTDYSLVIGDRIDFEVFKNINHMLDYADGRLLADESVAFVKLDIPLQQLISSSSNNISNHVESNNAHYATPAATPERMIIRDSSGRAKVAAPSESDDIARKAETDAVAGSLSTHTSNTSNPHNVTAGQIGAALSAHNHDTAYETIDANIMRKNVLQTMAAQLKAQNNTAYTAFQVRNIVLSTGDPTGGGNGDVWLKYS